MAYADAEDKAACVDLAEGDDCARGDGDPGICIPDESDPNVLTCDDDAAASDAMDGDGCTVGGDPSSTMGWAAFGLGMWWLARRRRD
ncbi:MAG TPA: hypothetical protein ENK57_07415 [Polyangiaceae bacterium]|nr:hypothetical protein [Polyangiaceae bacterium]